MKDNIDKLENVTQALLEFKTINGEEFDAVFERGVAAVQEIRDLNDGEMDTTIFKETEEDIAERQPPVAPPPVVSKAVKKTVAVDAESDDNKPVEVAQPAAEPLNDKVDELAEKAEEEEDSKE